VIFLDANHADVETVVMAGEMVVVTGEGELGGRAAAALLLADWGVLREGGTLLLDSAEGWAGAVWRLGRGAYALHLAQRTRFTAEEAVAAGLCDSVTAFELGGRSAVALDSAASLIRRRGGDALERAEFARLFAAGIPRQGLTAFLRKEKPRF
jgi:acetyl-CoA carboxylase alpha subunit